MIKVFQSLFNAIQFQQELKFKGFASKVELDQVNGMYQVTWE